MEDRALSSTSSPAEKVRALLAQPTLPEFRAGLAGLFGEPPAVRYACMARLLLGADVCLERFWLHSSVLVFAPADVVRMVRAAVTLPFAPAFVVFGRRAIFYPFGVRRAGATAVFLVVRHAHVLQTAAFLLMAGHARVFEAPAATGHAVVEFGGATWPADAFEALRDALALYLMYRANCQCTSDALRAFFVRAWKAFLRERVHRSPLLEVGRIIADETGKPINVKDST